MIVLGEAHLRRILNLTPITTTASERTGHWTKMHQSLAKFSEPEASNQTPSWADFITTTPVFSVHTAMTARNIAKALWLQRQAPARGRGQATMSYEETPRVGVDPKQ
jgi:hypothetical protein